MIMDDFRYSVHEVIYEEDEPEMDIANTSDHDKSPNGLPDDFLSKVDESWMMNESDEWNQLQNNAQNLADMIDRLEGTVKESFIQLIEKISGIEKADIDKTENLLRKFKTRWQTKCKETENLRISLKRATHESTRINDHYHEMEESVSKLRHQFGQAIDNSVTEIEELAICNNSLSETIQDLEAKIRRGDKAFKQNGRDNLASLKSIIKLAEEKDVDLKTLRSRLKKEADKIDRMIIVEDLFAVDRSGESGTTSNLTEKSQKMVDAISQGLVETLKKELQECRNIVDTQRRRIKDLEREKEEFLENQLTAQNDGVTEMNELLEYLRKSVAQQKGGSDDEMSDLNILKRNFNGMKRLVNSLNDGLDKSYKKVLGKSSEIIDLKDQMKELNEEIKTKQKQNDTIQEEKNYLKIKLEQTEKQYQLATDELSMIQRQLKTLDEERKTLLDEKIELKGGKEDIQDAYTSLTGENEKLGSKLKVMQTERDKVFTDLHEQIQKLNQYSIENNELEHKCENLEQAITKIRREYQDQTRELNMLTRENEEMKTSLQDNEQERLKLRRSMKSIETGNKDLEDQIFQLTNENQKLKAEQSKTSTNQKSQEEAIMEMSKNVESTELARQELEKRLKVVMKEKKEMDESNKTLKSSKHHDEEKNNKRQVLFTSYEKLLIKLLHQRKENLASFKLDKTEDNVLLQVSSIQSIDYKDAEQIEASLQTTAEEVENTHNTLSLHTQSLHADHTRYRKFCNDLSSLLKNYDSPENDSCYSTENDMEPIHVVGRDLNEGKRGLFALKSCNREQADYLPKLMTKVQRCLEQTNSSNRQTIETSNLTRKLHLTNKKLRQLKIKLKNRKTLEYNMKNKISHLKKEAKVLKGFHRSFHSKNKSPSPPPKENDNRPSQYVIDEVLKELKNAEEELKTVRSLMSKCSDENCANQVGEKLEIVDRAITQTTEQLSGTKTPRLDRSYDTIAGDELNERFEALSDQRQYLLDHLTFTNKRLEVLLNCFRGREEPIDENNNDKKENEVQPAYTRRVLKRVRDSFKNDQAAMKRAVSILELTKAISVTDLTEVSENKASNDEHRGMIVLVKNMNENMESVLREARTNITDGRIKKENTEPKKIETVSIEIQSASEVDDDLIPKSELAKKENELKMSLENAQKKVDTLSQFLEEREAEIKKRDQIIAKLHQEYDELKSKTNEKPSEAAILTRDRMIKEYIAEKKRLEKENEFLQLVVKEVREELLNFQKSYHKEEETQQHLQEFVNELQMCKTSLEHSLDKLAFELNIVKRDRDHLMQTIHGMGLRNSYSNPYFPSGPPSMHHGYHHSGYHSDAYYDAECSMCSYQDFSMSTTIPLSEDDWEYTDGGESLPSDGEQDGVVSSSESHTTTSSRMAVKMKTEEVAEAIKSKNKPEKYLKQETRTRKPILSPKQNRHRWSSMPEGDPFDAFSVASTITSINSTKPGRVQGRREMKQNRDSALQVFNSGRRSSQESSHSSRKSPVPDLRHRNSNRSTPDYHISSPVPDIAPTHAPVNDIDAAINAAANAEQTYYETKKASSAKSQLVTPFLSSGYDVKKRKKRFSFIKK